MRLTFWCSTLWAWPLSIAKRSMLGASAPPGHESRHLSLALLIFFAGYVVQFLAIPAFARKEFLGSYQVHQFVTEFYRRPVAVDQLGYVNYLNPDYVLDLSGLGSEAARRAHAGGDSPDWMNGLLASHNVDLAIIDTDIGVNVPASWIRVGELYPGNSPSNRGRSSLHLLRTLRRGRRPGGARICASLPARVRRVSHLVRSQYGLNQLDDCRPSAMLLPGDSIGEALFHRIVSSCVFIPSCIG